MKLPLRTIRPAKNEDVPKVTNGTAMEAKTTLSWSDRWKKWRKPNKSYLVTMFYSNGTTKTWIIKSDSEIFTIKDRAYYLRYEDAQFDLTNDNTHFYFNEDFAVPISREIAKMGEEAMFSVSPENLAPLIKMELVKAYVSSVEINKYMKMLVVIAGIGMTASVVGTILLLNMLRTAAQVKP